MLAMSSFQIKATCAQRLKSRCQLLYMLAPFNRLPILEYRHIFQYISLCFLPSESHALHIALLLVHEERLLFG